MFEAEKRLKSRSTIIDYFLPTEIGHRCVHHLQNIWRAPARIRNRTHCILPYMFFTGVELPILVPHPKYQNNESAHRCPFVHDKPRDKTLRVIPASLPMESTWVAKSPKYIASPSCGFFMVAV